MTDRVYMTRRGAVWHSDGACPALDDERGQVGGDVAQVTPRETVTALPCLVCQSTATEWVVRLENIRELINLIPPAKYRYELVDPGLQCTGLTIRGNRGVPRQVARFGDTIRLEGGRYYVTPREQP